MRHTLYTILLTASLLLSVSDLFAQRVDTIRIYSQSMQKEIPNLVILPQGYDKGAKYPVLYLLHGYSANYRTWLDEIRPDLPQLAGEYGMIIVCPNGENSWYFDSTVKKGSMYETYITKELINYIDSHYSTLPTKDKRAITGFSMGGHGAMYLAIRHQDLFGACGATSGGVDICPFPNEWEIKDVLGEEADNPDVWSSHSVINLIDRIKHGLNIIFDCGEEDFFYGVNKRLHEEMQYRHIKHDFISRQGVHSNAYWRNSIAYQLLYFHDFFEGRHVYRYHVERYYNEME